VAAGIASPTFVASTQIGNGQVILTYTSNAADLAEDYPTKDSTLNAGDIVSLDTLNVGFVKKATFGERIIGLVSTNPHTTMGQGAYPGEIVVPVALVGRVPTKVSDENGAIKIGDKITLSSVSGVGMKASLWDASVGYALEDYTGTGQGTIAVFIELESGFSFGGSSSTALVLGTSTINKLSVGLQTASSTASDQNAVSTTALQYIGDKISAGVSVLQEFVAGRIIAVVGYFDTIFARKVCLDKSDGSKVCITGDELDKLLIKNSISPAVEAPVKLEIETTPATPPTTTPATESPETPAEETATTTEPVATSTEPVVEPTPTPEPIVPVAEGPVVVIPPVETPAVEQAPVVEPTPTPEPEPVVESPDPVEPVTPAGE
jgi:hypothetical protein